LGLKLLEDSLDSSSLFLDMLPVGPLSQIDFGFAKLFVMAFAAVLLNDALHRGWKTLLELFLPGIGSLKAVNLPV
jgi:hypothetical protein